MKIKILIIILSVLLLTGAGTSSCSMGKVEKEKQEKSGSDIYMSKIFYEGHNYILFTYRNGYAGGLSSIHDPDCKCREEK